MDVPTQEDNVEQPDVDPAQFTDLLRTVWAMFENQICDDVEAIKMLKSAAASISNNETFKKIEEEFKLGALGEYVVSDQEALPFLTTVMSQLHHKIDENDSPVTENKDQPKKVTHLMTRFWEELEVKMGVTDATLSIVNEISGKVDEVAEKLEVDNPSFALSLSEIGVCIKESWKNFTNEVDRCIRHVRRKSYHKKSMEKVYARVICKGINTARTIQQNIESVKLLQDS